MRRASKGLDVLSCEDVVEHLHQDREVLAFIVRREDDRVFVLRCFRGRFAFGHDGRCEGEVTTFSRNKIYS